MPQAPYASVRASLDGGAIQTGGITASGGEVCQLSADPAGLAGATQYLWQLLSFPPEFTVPAGWSTDSDGRFYSTAATPSPFTLLSTAAGFGKYGTRLTLNGGGPALTGRETAAQKAAIEALTDTSLMLETVSDTGLHDLAYYEGTQFSPDGWVQHYRDNVRTLAARWVALPGEGDVIGPASSISGNLPVLSGTSGKLIADSGVSPADLGQLFSAAAYGCRPTASASANVTALHAAIDAASAAGKGRVLFREGSYSFDDDIDLKDGVTLVGAGIDVTVLDFSTKSAFSYGHGMFLLEGAGRSNVQSVTGNVAAGALSCGVTSGASFTSGSVVQIRSTENYALDGGTRAEFLFVRYVSGNTVFFTTPTQEVYNTGLGTVQLATITFATGGVSDLTIKGKGINTLGQPSPPDTGTPNESSANSERGDMGIEMRWCRDFTIDRVRFVDVENIAVYPRSCLAGRVSDCKIEFNPIREMLQYGIAPYACTQGLRVAGNTIINGRHAFTTFSSPDTATDYAFGVPNSIDVTGNKSYGAWTVAFDTHAGSQLINIENNIAICPSGGIEVRSRRSVVSGNQLWGTQGADTLASYAGIMGQYNASDLVVSGNRVHGFDYSMRMSTMGADFANVKVSGNQFLDAKTSGVEVSTGAHTCSQLSIVDNQIRGFGTYGIYLNGTLTDVKVDENQTFTTTGTNGLKTSAGVISRMSVCDNQFRGQSGEGFYVDTVVGLTVNGNQCYGSGTNTNQARIRNCKQGTVNDNYVEFPAGSTGGVGIWIHCTGSGLSSDLAIEGNTVCAPTSIGNGIYFEDQANQFHLVQGNHCRTCATTVRAGTDTTMRNLDVQRQDLTIATGVVTMRNGVKFLVLDTQSAASTDDLDTITYVGQDGDEVTVGQSVDGRDVTLKDATGNLRLAGDCVLTVANDTIKLRWRGSTWCEVGRSINS